MDELTALPDFPEVWDSSIRSTFVACPRQLYYSHILSLRKSATSIHLHFGGCVARALEVGRKAFWAEGKNSIDAVSDALKAFIVQWGDWEMPPDIEHSRAGVKTLAAGLDAVMSYFEQFPLSADSIRPLMVNGEPVVEKSFALRVPGTKHPRTGEEIVYAGRFDMIGVFEAAVFVVDEKTATALGSTWRSNWPLRGQLTGYCWGARSFGVDVAGCIVRGIGVLKGSIQFEQAVLSRPQWHVDAWLRQLTKDINRAAAMWTEAAERSGTDWHLSFDQAFDSACSAYGGCGFTSLCDSADPRTWYGDFLQIPWNPLERGEKA